MPRKSKAKSSKGKAMPKKPTIRERARAALHYPGSVPEDRTEGWLPTRKRLITFAKSELGKAYDVKAAMRTQGLDLNTWAHLMWMWARRTRRDLLVLEEYLREQRAAGRLKGPIPFYNDPGDPPPPPDSFF